MRLYRRKGVVCLAGGVIAATFLAAPAHGQDFRSYSFEGLSPARVSRTASDGFVVTDSAGEQLAVFGTHGALIRTIPLQGKPLAVGVDRRQRILVGNTTAGRVDIYSMGGAFHGSLSGSVDTPGGIAFAEDLGLIFVTDGSAHAVKVFDLQTGDFLYQFGSKGSDPGQFDFPTGIAYDPTSGCLVVGDFMNGRVQVLDPNGVWIRTIVRGGDQPMERPQGLDLDAAGNVFVADSLWARVYVFDSQGAPLRVLGTYGTADGELRTPLDVAVMPGGAVMVADFGNGRVAAFNEAAGGGQ